MDLQAKLLYSQTKLFYSLTKLLDLLTKLLNSQTNFFLNSQLYIFNHIYLTCDKALFDCITPKAPWLIRHILLINPNKTPPCNKSIAAINVTTPYLKNALIVSHDTFLCLTENIKIRRHNAESKLKSNKQVMKALFTTKHEAGKSFKTHVKLLVANHFFSLKNNLYRI